MEGEFFCWLRLVQSSHSLYKQRPFSLRYSILGSVPLKQKLESRLYIGKEIWLFLNLLSEFWVSFFRLNTDSQIFVLWIYNQLSLTMPTYSCLRFRTRAWRSLCLGFAKDWPKGPNISLVPELRKTESDLCTFYQSIAFLLMIGGSHCSRWHAYLGNNLRS